jgi:hypothetical protein
VKGNKIKYEGTLQQLYERDYEMYYFYNAVDSLLVLLIHYRLKCLQSPAALSSVTLVPLLKSLGQVALTTANVFYEFYLDGKHVVYKRGDLPNKEPYEGAFCGCVPGHYTFCVCDDFASLYPSQIRTCNLSFENYVRNFVGPDSFGRYTEIPWSENELEELNQRMTRFIRDVNRLYITDEEYNVSDISGLLEALKRSKEFYKSHYVELMKTGVWTGDFNTLPISFMDFSMFITAYKRVLGRKSHFGIVLDYQGSGAVVSQKAVNGLITKRIAGDAPMKVVCEPGSWKTYHDLNGMLAEDVHDYSTVDLDGSFKEHIKQLRLNNKG